MAEKEVEWDDKAVGGLIRQNNEAHRDMRKVGSYIHHPSNYPGNWAYREEELEFYRKCIG